FRTGDPLAPGSPSVDLGVATAEQCSFFHVDVTFTGVLRNSVLAWCGVSGSLTSLAECTDIWRPNAGSWAGTLEWLAPLYGNMEADPLICDYRNGVYGLGTGSPCLPANNSCGVTIGARTEECGTTGVEAMSWARVKAGYR
ncbi:hypothetical protein K8I85_09115, partial [bacterium]|nr:hypothetical protein [bacterium]